MADQDLAQSGTVAPARAWLQMAIVLGGALLLCVLTLFLPHNPYIRYQQFDQSDLFKLRWIYERLHFDPTPIDVAIVGSSRVEAAVSAPDLARALSAQFHRPIHVANIAVPYEGRNLHYTLTRELLRTHPECKLIVVSIVERADVTHPAFRYVTDIDQVLAAPLKINHYYASDIAFLPYRQMTFFVESLFPSWFQKSTTFRSDYLGTDWDSTQSFRIPGGRFINRTLIYPKDKLEHDAIGMKADSGYRNGRWVRPSWWQTLNNPLEPVYSARLVSLAKEHGTQVVFIHMPFYSSVPGQWDVPGYTRLAPVLDPQALSADPFLYGDVGHLNTAGKNKISAWLAQAIQPYTGTLETPPAPPQ